MSILPIGLRTSKLRKPRLYIPPVRTHVLHVRPGDGESFGVLGITMGDATQDYYLFVLPSDFGFTYKLCKIGELEPGEPDHYDVCLDAQDGRHACECKGYLRWGKCKHLATLLELHREGVLGCEWMK